MDDSALVSRHACRLKGEGFRLEGGGCRLGAVPDVLMTQPWRDLGHGARFLVNVQPFRPHSSECPYPPGVPDSRVAEAFAQGPESISAELRCGACEAEFRGLRSVCDKESEMR